MDPKIQIRYIDTKHQFADILTKGNFTRDEWNNLLHLFNISHFSSTCCAKDSSLIGCTKTMAKRMQEQKGRRKNCDKIKACGDEPVFTCFGKFLNRERSDPIASKSPILAALDTDHQHKFSLTNFSNLTVVLSVTLKSVDARSIYTLRRFTKK